jgi:hypothetical protein
MPSLKEINLPNATTFGDGCIYENPALVSLTINNTQFNVKNVDGSCFVIEKQRKFKDAIIYTGYNFGESKKCYVAEKDGFTAHGKTPKDAIKDLEFKIISEKMKNDPIDKDTVITVQYYRAVTGACEFGVRNWMKENNIEVEEIKAGELLPILKKSRAYGLEIFEKLLRF